MDIHTKIDPTGSNTQPMSSVYPSPPPPPVNNVYLDHIKQGSSKQLQTKGSIRKLLNTAPWLHMQECMGTQIINEIIQIFLVRLTHYKLYVHIKSKKAMWPCHESRCFHLQNSHILKRRRRGCYHDQLISCTVKNCCSLDCYQNLLGLSSKLIFKLKWSARN